MNYLLQYKTASSPFWHECQTFTNSMEELIAKIS